MRRTEPPQGISDPVGCPPGNLAVPPSPAPILAGSPRAPNALISPGLEISKPNHTPLNGDTVVQPIHPPSEHRGGAPEAPATAVENAGADIIAGNDHDEPKANESSPRPTPARAAETKTTVSPEAQPSECETVQPAAMPATDHKDTCPPQDVPERGTQGHPPHTDAGRELDLSLPVVRPTPSATESESVSDFPTFRLSVSAARNGTFSLGWRKRRVS